MDYRYASSPWVMMLGMCLMNSLTLLHYLAEVATCGYFHKGSGAFEGCFFFGQQQIKQTKRLPV